MAFRHGVAGGDVEKDWDVCTFDAGVFAGIKQDVLIRTIDYIVKPFFIGIHPNTSFLNVPPLIYTYRGVISSMIGLCVNYSTYALFCQYLRINSRPLQHRIMASCHQKGRFYTYINNPLRRKYLGISAY